MNTSIEFTASRTDNRSITCACTANKKTWSACPSPNSWSSRNSPDSQSTPLIWKLPGCRGKSILFGKAAMSDSKSTSRAALSSLLRPALRRSFLPSMTITGGRRGTSRSWLRITPPNGGWEKGFSPISRSKTDSGLCGIEIGLGRSIGGQMAEVRKHMDISQCTWHAPLTHQTSIWFILRIPMGSTSKFRITRRR